MVRGRGGMEEGEEEVVSSIPGGAGSPASGGYFNCSVVDTVVLPLFSILALTSRVSMV